MKEIYKPVPVEKINCPKCGELMIKIYPYSAIRVNPQMGQIPLCKLCQSKNDKK